MAGEASEVVAGAVANLPPWLQWGANIAVAILTIAITLIGLRRGTNAKADRDEKELAPEDIVETKPVKQALTDISTIADSMKLVAEAAKVMAGAAEKMAKKVDADFDEKRIETEVDRRLEVERRLRRIRNDGKSPETAGAYD